MEQNLESFLSAYPPAIQSLILEARQLITQVLPGLIEQIDLPSKIIAYGYGVKYADLICAIAPYPAYVNLMFSRGADLPDPEGLLIGTGKHARHVKLRTNEDLHQSGVQTLLEKARKGHPHG